MPERPLPLVAHPAHPSAGVQSIHVDVVRNGLGLDIVFHVRGHLDELRIPFDESGIRRDKLWQRTCFELFIRADTPSGYVEFNFSPGGDWAAYAFSAYRRGSPNPEVSPPQIKTSIKDSQLIVSVSLSNLPPEIAPQSLQLGPTAVIEAKDGSKSYWALDHLGEAPDFHRSETFTLSLD